MCSKVFITAYGKFILPEDWVAFLGSDVLNLKVTIAFRMKMLGLYSHYSRDVMPYLMMHPLFCVWYDRQAQVKVGAVSYDKQAQIAKAVVTNRMKYGVDYVLQNEAIREKAKATTLCHYGVENPFASTEIRSRIERTCVSKYGVSNPFYAVEVRDKIKQTNLSKFGGFVPVNALDIRRKISETRSKKSSEIRKVFMARYNYNMGTEFESLQQLRETILSKYAFSSAEGVPARSVSSSFKVKCHSCQSVVSIHWLSSGRPSSCPCCGAGKTLFERSVASVLSGYGIDLLSKNRSVIGAMEADLVIPSLHIGFEINGAYSHNSAIYPCIPSPRGEFMVPKPRLYHSHKTTCALSPIQLDFNTLQPILDPQGSPIPKPSIKLYHIWEHWPHEISLSIIKAKLGLFDRTYYARHLTPTIVSSSKLEELCGSHTQGFIRSSFGVALYLDAVAVMGLLFTIKGDVAELTRGVNALNTRVIGGFARLFKAAISYIKEVHPQVLRIITYADRDLTPDQDSCVYVRHGFTYVGDCGPTLSYYFRNGYPNVRFNSNRVYARQRLQKHKLVLFEGVMCKHPITGEAALFKFDPQETEQQNLFRLNVHPVYNSGCFKYELVL